MNNQLYVLLFVVAVSVIRIIVQSLQEQAAKKKAQERKLREQDEALRQGPSSQRQAEEAERQRGDEMITIPGAQSSPGGAQARDPLADLLRRIPGGPGTPGTTVPMPPPRRASKPTELERAREVGRRRAEAARRSEDARATAQAKANRASSNLPPELRPAPVPTRASQQPAAQNRPQSRPQKQPQRQAQAQAQSRSAKPQRAQALVTEEELDERRQHARQIELAGAKAEAQVAKPRGAMIGGTRMTAREWRRAIVVREILAPPLALREE